MRNILLLIILLFFVSCGEDKAAAGSTASCGEFVFANEMVATTYTGTGVTTSGTCDNAGQEYDFTFDGNYSVPASITGWRLINGVLGTQAGNINFTTGGRFQTNDGINEGSGLTFAGIDHTTCQTDSAQNGTADNFTVTLTAEFDANCNVKLRGTFREYAVCVDTSEVDICTGTITITP